ncbi:MAG: hypothetical protein J7647_15405 [Cyanobacteria bacterium SBLK]|nr:hypothetical protein [Cyanobacteria bacterium SBLK]
MTVLSDNDTIAYLRFYRLESKASPELSPPDLDSPARLDVIPENAPNKLVYWINDQNHLWRKSRDALNRELQKSPKFKAAKSKLNQTTLSYQTQSFIKKWLAPISVSILILVYLFANQKTGLNELILALIPVVYTIISEFQKS